MYTFNRNNRECIHKLGKAASFYDFTETNDYYMVNDSLNISHIKHDDMVKFIIYDAESGKTQKVYGFIMHIENTADTTFMVCRHYDERGNPFYLDYAYSSFRHAFNRLNRHGSFSDWNQKTHVKGAHAPREFVDYWMQTHVLTEQTTESPKYEAYMTSVEPGHDIGASARANAYDMPEDTRIYYM